MQDRIPSFSIKLLGLFPQPKQESLSWTNSET